MATAGPSFGLGLSPFLGLNLAMVLLVTGDERPPSTTSLLSIGSSGDKARLEGVGVRATRGTANPAGKTNEAVLADVGARLETIVRPDEASRALRWDGWDAAGRGCPLRKIP